MLKKFWLVLAMLAVLSGVVIAGDSGLTQPGISQGVSFQTAATATGNGQAANVGGTASIAVQVTITGTATVTFEGSCDNFTTAYAVLGSSMTTVGPPVSSATASDLFYFPVSGLNQFRCRISSYSSGSVTCFGRGVAVSNRGGQGGSSGGASPGGSNTQIQFNNSGAFGGTAKAVLSGNGVPTFAAGSIAANDPVTITQTWTNNAVTYNGLLVNVTIPGGDDSFTNKILEVQLAGVEKFGVDEFSNVFGALNFEGFENFSGGGSFQVGGNTVPLTVNGHSAAHTADLLDILQNQSGNLLYSFGTVANAVNGIAFTTATTGNPALISSIGTDSNPNLSIIAKNSGQISIGGGYSGGEILNLITTDNTQGAMTIGNNNAGNSRFGCVFMVGGASNAFFGSAGGVGLGANTDSVYSSLGGNLWLASNEIAGLEIIDTANGVNFLTLTPSATGNPVTLAATGSDASIQFEVNAKGSGGDVLLTGGNSTFDVNASAGTSVLKDTTDGVLLSIRGNGSTSFQNFLINSSQIGFLGDARDCITGASSSDFAISGGTGGRILFSGDQTGINYAIGKPVALVDGASVNLNIGTAEALDTLSTAQTTLTLTTNSTTPLYAGQVRDIAIASTSGTTSVVTFGAGFDVGTISSTVTITTGKTAFVHIVCQDTTHVNIVSVANGY